MFFFIYFIKINASVSPNRLKLSLRFYITNLILDLLSDSNPLCNPEIETCTITFFDISNNRALIILQSNLTTNSVIETL